jgi:hypothetical protein
MIRKGELAAAQRALVPSYCGSGGPPNGLGAALVSMHAFHRERGLDLRRQSTREPRLHQVLLKQRTEAEAFVNCTCLLLTQSGHAHEIAPIGNLNASDFLK